MKSTDFLDQIITFARQYERWREPIHNINEGFVSRYDRSGQFPVHELERAVQELTAKLEATDNLPARITSFLDQNILEFLEFPPEECVKIALAVCDNMDFSSLLLEYANQAISKLEMTGEESWFLRGLVALALENMRVDGRDSIGALADLCIAARERGLVINESLRNLARRSSRDKPKGWHKSMRAEFMYFADPKDPGGLLGKRD